MLPPRHRRLALAWLAVLLSSSVVSCKGSANRNERSACYAQDSYSPRTGTAASTTGFITAGSFQPKALTATTRPANSAWRWLLPGVKGASHFPTPSRTAGRSGLKRRIINARSDQDDLGEPAASNIPGSTSSHDVDVSPQRRWTLPSGVDEDIGDEGGGGRQQYGVHSLVDLVKLLHASDNPLWELVRFEVCVTIG